MADCCASTVSKLKKRLTIQNVSRTTDGQGGYTESWVDGATVHASIEPVKAWEKYQAAQLATPVTHKIVMRYNATVTTTSRLKYGDRIFNVKEVLNQNEANRFLTIKAIENQ